MAPVSPHRFVGLLLSVLLSAVACRSMTPQGFATAGPRFEPERFFEGPTHAWGVVENPRGNPISTFRASLMGRRIGSELVISQKFSWGDGRTEERTWHIRRIDEHRYEATASDVVGRSTGEAFGNVFRWEYTLAGATFLTNLRLHLWMYLQEDGETVINRVIITKLGVVVGRTTEYFRRGPAPSVDVENARHRLSPR